MRVLILGLILLPFAAQADDYADLRAELVAEVEYYAVLAGDSRDDRFSEGVVRSLSTVERHKFVPPSERRFAYENRPLAIGHGQTI